MAKKSKAPARAKKPGTAVAVAKPRLPAAPVTFLEFLDRASRDKDFDAAKFEVILAAKERQDARDKQAAFDDAIAKAQEAMAPIRADMENKQTKSRYASDVALDKAIRPIYSKYGIGLRFGTAEGAPADHVRVTCCVSCAGHREIEHVDMPADGKGAKGGDVMTKTHATGSAITYGNRYLILSIFNLKVIKKVGEPFADDDGQAAGGTPDTGTITAKQCQKIDAELAATKSDIPAFLWMMEKIGGDISIPDTKSIPAALYEQAMAKLAQKREKMPSTNAGRTQ